jgi:hypothetical protein
MNHLLKRTAIAVAAVVGFLGIASPAMAIQWGSASAPYYVKEDNVNQGKAYGDYGNYAYQYARSNAWYYDMKPGGEGIFVSTDFQFYYTYQGTTGWYTESAQQTSRTTSAAWKYQYKQKALHASADRSRGLVKVCEDHSFSGDPCSPTGFVTFSY